MRTLFIGRWQPFHAGHQALIETALREGRDVVIAVRDTVQSPDNPLGAADRQQRIQAALAPWGSRVTVIVIPDVDEVAYGRTPGWRVREIRLEADLEAVSATAIRAGWA